MKRALQSRQSESEALDILRVSWVLLSWGAGANCEIPGDVVFGEEKEEACKFPQDTAASAMLVGHAAPRVPHFVGNEHRRGACLLA